MLLITGATGHSGSFFLKELIKKEYEKPIRCIVRKSSDTSLIDESGLNIEKVIGDINDEDLINLAMKDVDEVMHIYNIHHSPKIVEAAMKHNVNWVILVHTTGIYSSFKNASSDYIQIEEKVEKLINKKFNNTFITILRPTMIYGDLCDSNMSKFIKMVDNFKILPILNKGENLLQPVNARDLGKAFYQVLVSPKNTMGKNYNLSGERPIKMIEVFKLISNSLSKKIIFISIPLSVGVFLSKFIKIISLGRMNYVEKVQRMGENRSYSHEKALEDFNYSPMPFIEGIDIEVKEYLEEKNHMNKVLIVANHFITIYAFRRELVKELLENNYEVYLALPSSEENKYFSEMGCEVIETPLDRRSTNPIADIKLILKYIQLMRKIQPKVVLTYTIKPNIYGGIVTRLLKSNAIHTVTGLGSMYIQNMKQKKVVAYLNKLGFKNASKIIFLNEDNKEFYKKLGITSKKSNVKVVPGSGVNLERFSFEKYPSGKKITFTFVGRVLKDKGIEEFLIAAKNLKNEYPDLEFEVVGFIDEKKYEALLTYYENEGIITYLGNRKDMPNIMKKTNCIVLPSYGEGRGTVLQEGAATGRPLITSNTFGCKDNVVEGVNGYLSEVGDVESLKSKMEKFINLPLEEKIIMGEKSRELAEENFDRKIVVKTYREEIEKIIRNNKE